MNVMLMKIRFSYLAVNSDECPCEMEEAVSGPSKREAKGVSRCREYVDSS